MSQNKKSNSGSTNGSRIITVEFYAEADKATPPPQDIELRPIQESDYEAAFAKSRNEFDFVAFACGRTRTWIESLTNESYELLHKTVKELNVYGYFTAIAGRLSNIMQANIDLLKSLTPASVEIINTLNQERPKNLFRVAIKVRPTPEHPLFWQMQFGTLDVWLYAPTGEKAALRACWFLTGLPYERDDKEKVIWEEFLGDVVSDRLSPAMILTIATARVTGIAFHLDIAPTGTAEPPRAKTEPTEPPAST